MVGLYVNLQRLKRPPFDVLFAKALDIDREGELSQGS
jgi:hypothetical protein